MQSVTFKDPVTGDKFQSSKYEVRTNGSGRVLRSKAPSGAMAVVMDSIGVDSAPTVPQFADDITQEELTNMVEDYQDNMGIETNPPGGAARAIGTLTKGVGGLGPGSWQSLRLPGVSFGERGGVVSRLAGVFRGLGIDRGSFRNGHASTLITARMWTDYINNMGMQDVGAELNASVSPEEKFSIYEFCKEWERDPAHTAFVQRLFNTPDVNSIDEIAKGQIVYDLMTGGITPGPSIKDPTTVKHDKMFRLALDIINSIRMRDYNFYTLNVVHRDEGTRLYDDFMANYVPLEPDEVEVIFEVMRGIETHGQSYAFKQVDNEGDPMGAYDLMIRLGNAYNAGDTRLCRSILDTLFAFPYRFTPNVGYKGLFSPTSSRFIGEEPLHLYINQGWRWILPSNDIRNEADDGRKFDVNEGTQLIEVLDFNYPKPVGVFTKIGGGKNKFSYMPWATFERTVGAASAMVPSSSSDFDQRVQDAQRADSGKTKTQSGGGGGGGGNKNRNRNRSGRRQSRNNPPFDAAEYSRALDYDKISADKLKAWCEKHFDAELKRELDDQGNRGWYQVVLGMMLDAEAVNGFRHVIRSFEKRRNGDALETIALEMGQLYNGRFDIVERRANSDVQGYTFTFYPNNEFDRIPSNLLGPLTNPAPGRKGRKSGTLSLGRGKQYHIEILPKTQLKGFSKGAPGVDKKTGKSRPKGRSTVKAQGKTTKGERKAGITDAFGTYMHTAIDKVTEKEVPFVIKVPSSRFRAVNLEVDGKTIRTLMPMVKTSKAQQEAWAKFLSVYGYPKLANTKGDPVRFKIHKPTRGSFYRQLARDRKKAGA